MESEGRLLPGAVRALDLTGERGPLALASSTPMALIVRCLKHFGLLDRFVAIHSAEHEPYGKPHPGVFLSAALSLGVRPLRAWCSKTPPLASSRPSPATMTVMAVPTPDDPIDRSSRSRTGAGLARRNSHRVARRTLRLEVLHKAVGERVRVCSRRILLDRVPARRAIELQRFGLRVTRFEVELS